MDATADLEEYKFMFKQRLISGIILVLIAAFGLYMGGIVTFAMTLIVALIGYSEILKIYHIEKSSLAVIGYTGTILYYVALLFDLDQWTTAIIIFFLCTPYRPARSTCPTSSVLRLSLLQGQFHRQALCQPYHCTVLLYRKQ